MHIKNGMKAILPKKRLFPLRKFELLPSYGTELIETCFVDLKLAGVPIHPPRYDGHFENDVRVRLPISQRIECLGVCRL